MGLLDLPKDVLLYILGMVLKDHSRLHSDRFASGDFFPREYEHSFMSRLMRDLSLVHPQIYKTLIKVCHHRSGSFFWQFRQNFVAFLQKIE